MSVKSSIEDKVLDMIRRGVYMPGDKLPSIRTMASDFNVSSSPVVDAYTELVAMQIVESRRGSGYYVSSNPVIVDDNIQLQKQLKSNKTEHFLLMDDFIAGYSELVFNANDNLQHHFGTTSASSLLYPEKAFNNALAKAIRKTDASGNLQVRLRDDILLKKSIMKWMQPCQCKNSIDDISIVRSVTEGVMLAVRSCTSPGDVIAVEAPGHAGFHFIAKFLERKVLPVQSHPKNGFDVKEFEKLLRRGRRPSCVLLTSNFSNPTGALMPDSEKEKLTSICAQYQIPIIEDDILGELYFTKERPRPLKSFDNDNVIYVSGFGKCLNPSLRMGYVSAGRYSEAFAMQKHMSTAYAHVILQQGLVDFMESGLAAKHVSFFRKNLCRNMEGYRSTILESFPRGTRVDMPQGGPYLWVTLPRGLSADELCNLSKKEGISIAPGRLFNAGSNTQSSFRFNCIAQAFDSGALQAVERLGKLACFLDEIGKK